MYMYMYIVPLFVFVSRYLSPFFFCFLNDSNHAYAYPLCARNHPWIDYKTVWIYCRILSSIDLLKRNFAIRYICLLEVNYLNRETMLRRFQLYWTVYSLMSSDKWNSTIRVYTFKNLKTKNWSKIGNNWFSNYQSWIYL